MNKPFKIFVIKQIHYLIRHLRSKNSSSALPVSS
jgi:hypothetical protein